MPPGANAVQRALARVLSVLRQRRPWSLLATSFEPALDELRAAVEADTAALAGEDSLRELAALVAGPRPQVARGALRAVVELVFDDAPARRLEVARADGMAAALAARLRSCAAPELPKLSSSAMAELSKAPAAARELLERAPGVVAAAAEHFALAAPRAAAERAGVDVAAVAAAARAAAAADEPQPSQSVRADTAANLLITLKNALVPDPNAPLALEPELPGAPPYFLPALAALAAHSDGDGDLGRSALQLLSQIVSRAIVPRATLRFFDLGARGGLVGVEAALRDVVAQPTSKDGDSPLDGVGTAMAVFLLIFATLGAVLHHSPKRLGGAAGAAWAAAAARLKAYAEAATESVKTLPPSIFDAKARAEADQSLDAALAALTLVAEWAPKARQAAATAAAASAAQSGAGGGGDNGSSTAETRKRCCAACGRTRADGARLHRCRGCGAFTGVMYCGAACAREHWVRGGHRKVCEPAAAQLRELLVATAHTAVPLERHS